MIMRFSRLSVTYLLVFCASCSMSPNFNTAATFGGAGFEDFACSFTVPDVPAYAEQSIFLWCGVQQSDGVTTSADTSFGVLQPVLMFGSDCVQDLPPGQIFGPGNDPNYESDPYWYWSAQYVYPAPLGSRVYQCTTGPVFKAQPGDVLNSRLSYNDAADSMIVQMTDGSRNSTLTVNNPWDMNTEGWAQFIGGDAIVMEGMIEVWNLQNSSQWPTGQWVIQAETTALISFSFGNDMQWKLIPLDDGALSVTCTYSTVAISICTWTFPLP